MKASQVVKGIAVGAAAVLMSATQAFAQVPIIAQTWVSGTVYSQSGTPVNGGTTSVNCGGIVKTAAINADGSYAVSFTQEECSAGDTASATANTSEGSGSNSAPVENTSVNGPIVDLDVAVIDITVPEFGVIGGALTGLASVGGYLVMKAKHRI